MKKVIAMLSTISLIGLVSMGVNASTIRANDLAQSGIGLTKVKSVTPDYPSSAISQKIQGKVTLSYDLTTDGEPTNIKVVDFEGSKHFIRSSINALKNTRFEPVLANNQAVKVIGLQKQYDFLLISDQSNKVVPGLTAFNL
jgi:TonB family protein